MEITVWVQTRGCGNGTLICKRHMYRSVKRSIYYEERETSAKYCKTIAEQIAGTDFKDLRLNTLFFEFHSSTNGVNN